jgi:V8-like Glu-specific endopeptidase
MRQTCRVCRVEIDGTPRGTGFLVGPDVVLTSYHVVRDAIRARLAGPRLAFLFDYWRKPDGSEAAGTRVEARSKWPDWHVDSSPPLDWPEEHAGAPSPTGDQLDHALIRLDRPLGAIPVVVGGQPRGWIDVPATAPTLTIGMPIAILHHPRTGPVKLTLDTHALLRVNQEHTRLRYATNSDNGSSGAPCLSVGLQLVGMHHFADPEQKVPTYNQGIPIAAVYQRLQRLDKLAALRGEWR